MVVNWLGLAKVTDLSASVLGKAFSSIDMTLAGIVTLVSEELKPNEYRAIEVTPLGMGALPVQSLLLITTLDSIKKVPLPVTDPSVSQFTIPLVPSYSPSAIAGLVAKPDKTRATVVTDTESRRIGGSLPARTF